MSAPGEDQAALSLIVILVGLWGFLAWHQPTERVYTVCDQEYRSAIPLIQGIMGPVSLRSLPMDSQRLSPANALSVGSARMENHLGMCVRLLELRALTFGAIYLIGLPLLVAFWQLGKARQRVRMRTGIPPSPRLQAFGWTVAAAGFLLVPMVPGPFAAATVVSFGWLGVAGVALSAVGAYLIGSQSRSG